jgi:hypothetical protein
MIDKENDEKFKGLESIHKFFSKCVWVDLYVGVVGLHFIKEYLDCWQLQTSVIVYSSYWVNHTKEDYGSL